MCNVNCTLAYFALNFLHFWMFWLLNSHVSLTPQIDLLCWKNRQTHELNPFNFIHTKSSNSQVFPDVFNNQQNSKTFYPLIRNFFNERFKSQERYSKLEWIERDNKNLDLLSLRFHYVRPINFGIRNLGCLILNPSIYSGVHKRSDAYSNLLSKPQLLSMT